MIDGADIQAAEEAIICLADQLQVIIDHATSDQWKDSHVQEMSNFYEINELLEKLGYEGGG